MNAKDPVNGTSDQTTGPIIVAVDLSPESLYALDLAAAIAEPQGSPLHVVHVHHGPASLSVSASATVEFERAETEVDALIKDAMLEHLAAFGGDWDLVSRRGNIGHELLAEADDVDAELIVVGHRSHGTMRDMLLGSVASNIVHHSRRSVLVAIPPKDN